MFSLATWIRLENSEITGNIFIGSVLISNKNKNFFETQ